MKNTKERKTKSSYPSSSLKKGGNGKKKNFIHKVITNKWIWVGVVSVLVGFFLSIWGFSAYVKSTCSLTPLPKNNLTTVTQIVNSGEKVADERREEATYLTYPEWYIVYSAHEYADFIKTQPPSQFPYGGAIYQYWCGYQYVSDLTEEKYAYNSGAHTVLQVIGVSFTAEYIVKSIYEHTFGLYPELLTFGKKVAEEDFAYFVANDYANFLHHTPWYDYPFAQRLGELWTTTPFWGENQFRKWERKVSLSLEYGIKAGYGFVIRKATAATYSPAEDTIVLRVKGVSDEMLQKEPAIQIVKEQNGMQEIVIPRYTEFTRIILEMAKENVEMSDIAGNHMIFITGIARDQWQGTNGISKELFRMPVLTQKEKYRIGIQTEVKNLVSVIQNLQKEGVFIEHIYDY